MSKLSDALDELTLQMRNRGWFDLTTPDPAMNSRYSIRPEDQLPGRPTEGKIEIGRFFECLQLFVTEAQRQGSANGVKLHNYLKAGNLPVLGPNVGQFLFERQEFIPVELRGKVVLVFWGKVYRGSTRFVRALTWYPPHKKWVWAQYWLDGKEWPESCCAVLLKS